MLDLPSIHIITGFFLFLTMVSCWRYLLGEYGGWHRFPRHVLVFLFFGLFGFSALFLAFVPPSDIAVAVSEAGGISLSFVHPVVAVSFFIANLLIRPWEIFDNNMVMNMLPRLLAVIAIISWIISRFRARRISFIWNTQLTVFAVLIVWLFASALLSPYTDDNLPWVFSVFFPIFVVCLLLSNSVEKEKDLALLKRSLALSLTGIISVAMAMTMATPDETRLTGPGLAGNSNDLAALAVLALPFLLIPNIRSIQAKKIAWFDLIYTGILITGLVMTKSRGGILALAGACLLYIIIVSKSLTKLLIWMAVAAPVLLGFMSVAMKRDAADLEGSSDSRWGYILAGFNMVKAHPLFGVGVNNYPRSYDQYAVVWLESGLRTAHSSWMLILSETGPLGLLLFAWLYFNSAYKAWGIRKTSPELIMAIIGYGILMSMLSHCYTFFPYFLIFVTATAVRIEAKTA